MEMNNSNTFDKNGAEALKNEEINSVENDLDERKAQLDAREKELSEKADKSAVEEKRLEILAQELDRRENNAALKEKMNADESERLKQIEATLDKRGKDISQRELDAAEGFKKLREKELGEEVALLNKEISELQKKKLEIISSLETQRKSLIDDANKSVESIISEASETRKKANEILTETRKKQDELAIREAEINEKEGKLNVLSGILNEERSNIDKTAHDIANGLSERTKNQLDLSNKRIDDLNSENEELRKQLTEFERTQRAADGRTLKQLIDAENENKEHINQLKNKCLVFEREKESIVILESKAKAYDQLLEENKNLKKENASYAERLASTDLLESNLSLLKDQCTNSIRERDAAKASAEALAAEMNVLKQTVASLKTMAERSAEVEDRIKDIEGIRFADKFDKRKDSNEIAWLDSIAENIAASNIKISKRLLYAFHTSLKTADWSPITVLAGVSGTGKSLLPKLYAMYGGFYYMPLAVQPDWDSPQSLFGFFNALDNRFNPTKLLSALVQFQPNTEESLSDYMMIVLLDEMNLAYVELYFSELLSKLEDRRDNKSSISIDVELGAGMKKYEVKLDRNIFWVGTMNEDETTKTLSDKVIDRSNMLSFPRPKEFARRQTVELVKASEAKLPKAVWNKWVEETAKIDDNILESYKTEVEKINEALGKVGRALGHRVWQAIESYICSHPRCIVAANKPNKDGLDEAVRKAFEEAVVFKIMPKLRGIEITKHTKDACFTPIQNILKDYDIAADFGNAVSSDQFVWRTSDYLDK